MSSRDGESRILDLVVANIILFITAGFVFLPISDVPLVWGGIGLICSLIVPGYALVSGLFPDRNDLDMQTSVIMALTVPISSVVIIAVGILLDVFYVFSSNQLVGGVLVVTQLLVAVAGLRRWTSRKASPIVDFRLAATRLKRQFDRGPAVRKSLYIIGVGALVLIVLIGTTNIGASTTSHTEMYLEPNEDGSVNIDKTPGNEVSVVVHNKEQRPQLYSLVVQLQVISANGPQVTVLSRNQQLETRFRLENGASNSVDYTIPSMDENPVRIAFLLFTGDAPATPSINNAYRELHIWMSNETRSAITVRSNT